MTAPRPAIDGPFLVLVVCEATIDGRPDPFAAFAMSIYHARRFIPVHSDLDRDVLCILERLQTALDAYGVDCTIKRVRTAGPLGSTRLIVSCIAHGTVQLDLSLITDGDQPTSLSANDTSSADFVVTQKTLSDGSFVAWLERAIVR